MRNFILAVCGGVIFVSSATAAEITNSITDSVQLTVTGAGISNTRMGSSYAVSGSNINVTTLGRLTGGSATAPSTLAAGTYAINTNGQAYTFAEELTVGDTVVTTQATDATLGTLDAASIYSENYMDLGGTKGTLAGTLSATGIPTVTAGGQGTTAIGQRTISLTMFD